MSNVNYPEQSKPHEAFKVYKVLDCGFVRLVDCMPSPTDPHSISADAAIVQAARVSYGQGTKSVSEDKSLITYLIKHYHTSPLEMIEFKFHCRMPIFVARQWIRHRTANVNEYSARYSEVQDMSYLPEEFVIMGQGVSNKQGSEGELNSNTKYEFIKSLESLSIKAYHEYKKALENGIARETARMILPVSYYTEWYWKIDLHNLFHFIRLRNDSHAQYEIRVYAEAMYDIVKKIAPIASDAFESFVRNSVSVSSLEKECLRLIVNDGLKIEESIEIISNKYNMTKRKAKELKDIIENILIENK
jgi:thymidylate synthase (FAD)